MPNTSLDINGHADAREDAADKQLAQKRAQAVATYLQQEGIPANQLSIKNIGKTKQAGPDNTETGRRRNRRASFTLYSSELSVLADNLNASNPLAVQITEKKFLKGENKAIDAVDWQKGTYTSQLNGREYLIIIKEVLPPGYKQLNEVRGVAISDYQNYLEEQWVKELREKYPVSVNKTEVEKLIK